MALRQKLKYSCLSSLTSKKESPNFFGFQAENIMALNLVEYISDLKIGVSCACAMCELAKNNCYGIKPVFVLKLQLPPLVPEILQTKLDWYLQ